MIGAVVKIYQPKQSLPKIFLFLCVSVFIWTAGYAVNYETKSETVALWACRAAFLGVIFIPSTTLHFVIRLLKLSKCYVLVWLGYAVSLIFIPIIWTDLFLAKMTVFFWGYYPLAGPFYGLFVAYYAIVFFACVALLFVSYIRQQTVQVKYVLIAFFIALWSLVDYLPNYGIEIYPFAYLCALGWIITISYSITRHRLFDIEAVVDVIHRDRLAMLGLLSASVNHEIKNPLYIMRGQFDLLKETGTADKDPRLARCIEQMDLQIQRIQKLLKMYSGLGAGSQPKTAEVCIKKSLTNVVEFLEFEFKRRSIQIELIEESNLPLVRCTRFELESIILNLLLNACQAIDASGKIAIQTGIDADKVTICIQDTGPGLSKEQRRRLFEPLATTKPEGSGLGLFITKSIVEKYGGHLEVVSERGHGAIFKVFFVF